MSEGPRAAYIVLCLRYLKDILVWSHGKCWKRITCEVGRSETHCLINHPGTGMYHEILHNLKIIIK